MTASSTRPEAVDYFNRHHPLHAVKIRVALQARRRMFARALHLLQPTAAERILDVGTTPDLEIPYNNFFERWYSRPEQVTACSIEDCSCLEHRFPGLAFRPISGERLPCADGEFDVAVSFAVLEHVGSQADQRRFMAELARVSRRFVLYTPYRYFPIEMHTFVPFTHWLPPSIYRSLWRRIGLDFWADERNLNLLTVADVRRLLPTFGSARVALCRSFGWPSNIEVFWQRS